MILTGGPLFLSMLSAFYTSFVLLYEKTFKTFLGLIK